MARGGVWLAIAITCVVLQGCASCDDEEAAGEAATTEPGHAEPAFDAAPAPTAAAAATVLRRFAVALEASDLAAARAELRVPADLGDEEIDAFLQELVDGEHVSVAGVDAVIARGGFGPAAERFADAGANVVTNAGLADGAGYAFGDAEAAALLVWDGARFKVAAVHNLVSLEGAP